jgi:hypothetical protein
MKTKLLAIMLLAGSSMFAETRVAIGLGFGGNGGGFNQPGPDYTWVDGYRSQNHGRDRWVAGYWNRQPFNRGHDRSRDFDHHNSNHSNDERNGHALGFRDQ